MISIKDDDKQRIERAVESIKTERYGEATSLLLHVLDNIRELMQEKPHVRPLIAAQGGHGITESKPYGEPAGYYPHVVAAVTESGKKALNELMGRMSSAINPLTDSLAAVMPVTPLDELADSVALCQCRGRSKHFDYHSPDECGVVESLMRAAKYV